MGGGAVVYEMPSALPTPLVAYCVKALHAAAGIMITASHNPPEDNGYKLYAGDGAQIVPPDDEIVERHMRDASRAELGDRTSSLHSYVPESVLEEYRRHVVERFHPSDESALAITYTPLHGVGGATMMRLFGDAGSSNVATVTRQFEPDGSFPTLAFPNPEEPGALDLAIETATAANSSVILANDPDADRLGAAVRDGDQWRVLRGDEIGWLLASSLIEESAIGGGVATTIVSSTLLGKMASAYGVPYTTTLTGFKWLARSAGEGHLGFRLRRGARIRRGLERLGQRRDVGRARSRHAHGRSHTRVARRCSNAWTRSRLCMGCTRRRSCRSARTARKGLRSCVKR